MPARSLMTLPLLVLLQMSVATTCGNGQAAERLYRIQAGTYAIIGGIWGQLTQTLPTGEQAFVRLVLDSTNGAARMTILDASRERAFNSLTNGVPSGAQIRFYYQTDGPWPQADVLCQVDYEVTYDSRALTFEGSRTSTEPICCDFPHTFIHSNVVAEACPVLRTVPAPPGRGLLTFVWENEPGVRLQRTSRLPALEWADVPGSTGTNTITLPMSAGTELFRLARP